jgi:putative hemolysin
VDGLLNAKELKESVGVSRLPDEPEEDYQTVGGMVMARLGRVPRAGDCFDWEGLSFEVVDMDGLRVDKVLVARVAGSASAEDTPQG